jgi:cyclopropane fatty-acyl-phospholipid synthase-like methyltransferase
LTRGSGDGDGIAVAKYKPDIFVVPNVDKAKEIILTFDGTRTPEERWQQETPILAELISRHLEIARGQLVLDYGCGIGRLAKALIERNGCGVVGVDISVSMLQLAPGYVGSAVFAGIPPAMLEVLTARGLRFDSAYAVWVIQHCLVPREDLQRIADALKPDGRFEIINTKHRCVPTDKGWANDNVDIIAILHELFEEVKLGVIPPGVEPPTHPDTCYAATCRGVKLR